MEINKLAQEWKEFNSKITKALESLGLSEVSIESTHDEVSFRFSIDACWYTRKDDE